jgi:hypothetical protein
MLIALVILPLVFVTAGLGFYKIKPTLIAPERRVKPKTVIGICCFSAKHAALKRKS